MLERIASPTNHPFTGPLYTQKKLHVNFLGRGLLSIYELFVKTYIFEI